MRQVLSSEIPYINLVLRMAEDWPKEFESIALEIDAWIGIPVQRKASMNLARNWLRLSKHLSPNQDFEDISTWFRDKHIGMHYLSVFPLCLDRLGYLRDDALGAHWYMALRDQISAAIRLGIVGPLEGHGIQCRHLEKFALLEKCQMENLTAFRGAPMLEIHQAGHDHLYSRLFQS